MRLSFSSLDNYQTCPLKYKFKEIDKIKEPKTAVQFFGTTLHKVLEYIHTPGFTSPTLEDALDFFSKHWDESVFPNELENRGAFSQGVDIIQRYYTDNDVFRMNIVALEKRFAVDLPYPTDPEKTHVISGVIDRIDRTEKGYEIIDYKTARKMPTQDDVNTNIQLSIYLLAFLKMYPTEKNNLSNIQVSLYFLKHGQKLTATRTQEDLDSVTELFLKVIKDIEEEKFEPRISPLCSWCGYQEICPMWRHKFKEVTVETGEMEKVVEEYIQLKKESTQQRRRFVELQKTIENYIEQEDIQRVFTPNAIVEKSLRKTYGYDEEKLRTLLEPLDRWEDVLKIDGISLRKVLGSLPSSLRKEAEDTKEIKKETSTLVIKKRVKE